MQNVHLLSETDILNLSFGKLNAVFPACN